VAFLRKEGSHASKRYFERKGARRFRFVFVIIFDMEYLNYISSMGVRVVLKARKALEKRGGNIILLNLKPHIKKVFDIINALPSEQVFSSVEEMDQYLDRMQRKITED
jgi:anti-sigma B factor antagonist